MAWFNPNNTNDAVSTLDAHEDDRSLRDAFPTLICPSCAHPAIQFHLQGGLFEDRLPAGVKFDPSDQQILEHLEAKVKGDKRKVHPLIDEFIPTLHGDHGICYTHPQNLPGMRKDGEIRHFFHGASKAYTAGTRKRRKVVETGERLEGTTTTAADTRWHKTGKTRAVMGGDGVVMGFKKILVLYSNSKYGFSQSQRKAEKTKWIMHQYHLGVSEHEKDGELVASKVFFQIKPPTTPLLVDYGNPIIITSMYERSN